MLIYNFQKKFLGIDLKELRLLGYNDLESLKSEVSDFADLFVKTPGHIYNFQHVHWIDFVECADDGEVQRVIINANGKTFTANIIIDYAYLTDNPIEKAYLIYLHNLRPLTDTEVQGIHNDILERPIPTPTPVVPKTVVNEPLIQEQVIQEQVIQEPLSNTNVSTQNIVEPLEFKEEKEPQPIENIYNNDLDAKLDLDMDFAFDTEDEPLETTSPVKTVEEVKTEQTSSVDEEYFDNGYIYSPEVACKELGLPVDLIEEFVQDFIAQAKEFKPKLYSALKNDDINEIQSLSHKLKGVAANLRIEDALEVLTIINTSSDFDIIKMNLDLFYKIIAKLSGEEIELNFKEIEEIPTLPKEEEPLKSDNFTVEFKDDTPKDDKISLEFKDDDITETIKTPIIEVNYSKFKVADEIGLDIESFNELFHDYIDETRTLIKEMQEAISIGNFDRLKSEAIKLKGMSNNMRVNSFNSELGVLIHSENQEESLSLINKINDILEELSKVGA